MISLFRTTLIGLLIMAGTSSLIVCQADYQETYVNTITRAVGPTTLTGARGTLPVPVPTDGNSIWLAKNGNDGNAGTQALPKLTVAGAIAALGAITNIHIFRNGYVGDLDFTQASTQTLPSGGTLQVEEGEMATITLDAGTFVLSGANAVNGVRFESPDTPISISGATQTLSNISVFATTSQAPGVIDQNDFDIAIEYSILGSLSSLGLAGTTTIDNCILMGAIANNIRSACIAAAITNGDSPTFEIYRSIITNDAQGGGGPAFTVTGVSGTASITFDVNSSYVNSIGLLVGVNGATSTLTVNYDADYCFTTAVIQPTITNDAAITLTSNITDTNKLYGPALLVNEADMVSSFDAGLGRLQIRGKDTPDASGTYLISSPLYQAGDSGVDVNPWDETVTGPTLSYGTEFAFELGHSDHDVTFNFVNPVQLQALTGGLEIDWDSILRARRINWSGGDRDALNNDWKRVVALLKDKGTKKVYLKGLSGNFLQNENGSFMFTEATFDDTDTDDGTITPADGSFSPVGPAAPLIYGNWDNFLIEVEVGASDTREYWIKTSTGDNNNTGKLYIVDKLGQGLPSNGTYPVAIRAFWAHLALDPLTIPWPAASARPDFSEGNEWAEGFGGSADPNQERYQAKQFSLVLIEQPDPRTNTA